jgi:hypothetical protein
MAKNRKFTSISKFEIKFKKKIESKFLSRSQTFRFLSGASLWKQEGRNPKVQTLIKFGHGIFGTPGTYWRNERCKSVF